MAQRWRKYAYDHVGFGQQVKACRQTLQWSLNYLALECKINRGTLHKVEMDGLSLPPTKRQRLVDVLLAAGVQFKGRTGYRDFLLLPQLAGLSPSDQSHKAGAVDNIPQIGPSAIQAPAHSDTEHSQVWHETQVPPLTLEAHALALERQSNWPDALTLWQLIARQAHRQGDRIKWAHCMLHIGTVAVTLGWCTEAERAFEAVLRAARQQRIGLSQMQHHVVRSEALLRLGWLRFEQDAFARAITYLREGLKGLRAVQQELCNTDAGRGDPRNEIAPAMPWTVGVNLQEALHALEEFGSHFLGRALGESSLRKDNSTGIQQALVTLRYSNSFNVEQGLDQNVGFGFLRQAHLHAQLGESDIAERLLRQGEELMGAIGLLPAHVAWTRARLYTPERPGRAHDELIVAQHGFTTPIFYSRGVSRTVLQRGILFLQEGTLRGDQLAFRFAAVATALFPYGETLATLEAAAAQLAWRMGARKALSLWSEMRQAIWAMEDEPCIMLRELLLNYGYTRGVAHLEDALQRAEQVIQSALAGL
jgi:hypothetical protein